MELFLKALGDRSTTLESQKREKNEREKIGSQLQALCGKVTVLFITKL
jgi:hypothetical protein